MDVNVGDVCYRHENKRLCVFFGKTPASTSEKPVPAAPVVVIGRILCSPEELRGIKEGEILKITIEEDKPPVCPASENDRKLTQAEIDELVKKLLEAKKQAKNIKRIIINDRFTDMKKCLKAAGFETLRNESDTYLKLFCEGATG